MNRYHRAGQMAINAYLAEHKDQASIPIFTLSVVADAAAREMGRKRDLFESVFDYSRLLPENCRTAWIGGDYGSIYSAINPYTTQEQVRTLPMARRPMAGAFDMAVDMGPDRPPSLPYGTDPATQPMQVE